MSRFRQLALVEEEGPPGVGFEGDQPHPVSQHLVLRLADCSARSLEQRLYLHDAGVLVHVDLLDGHARHV